MRLGLCLLRVRDLELGTISSMNPMRADVVKERIVVFCMLLPTVGSILQVVGSGTFSGSGESR